MIIPHFSSLCNTYMLMEDYAEKRAREVARDFAIELWNDGMHDMEKIAKLTKLPLDEVKKLFEGKTA